MRVLQSCPEARYVHERIERGYQLGMAFRVVIPTIVGGVTHASTSYTFRTSSP